MRGLLSDSRWVYLLLLVLAGFAFGGCASMGEDNVSERPWSAPQGWENNLPSGMFNPGR